MEKLEQGFRSAELDEAMKDLRPVAKQEVTLLVGVFVAENSEAEVPHVEA